MSREKDSLDPWAEIEQVRAEADRLLAAVLERLGGRRGPGGLGALETPAFVPEADVVESDLEFRLYYALAGVVEDDIDITVRDDFLIVRGERTAPFDQKKIRPHCAQWKYGFFECRHRLPIAIDRQRIHAHFERGVLVIRVPKTSGGADER